DVHGEGIAKELAAFVPGLFMGAGGVHIISVFPQDTGIGISEEDLPHLFDRFYRGQFVGQSNIPGTGLGLAVVKAIVVLHGGDIKVTSKEGAGSVFVVTFPIAGKD
ncbi:MAG: sensor histidine kinase, partial [Anaerolineae bacterium]